MGDLAQRAEALARRAHNGQVDKAGRPYIEHVERVVARVRGDDVAEAVAWLHDVLEDCQDYLEEFWSFPAAITWRVGRLTRIKGQASSIYYDRIAADPIAKRVKLADIADNADPERLALLPEVTATRLRRKYADALARVTARGGEG